LGAESGGGDDFVPGDHNPQTGTLVSQKTLHHQLVAKPPKRVENALEVIPVPAQDDTDSHSGAALFDHNREAEALPRDLSEFLRICSCNGLWYWKTGGGEDLGGLPMVAASSNRRGRIGSGHTCGGCHLERCEKALGTPVADSGQNPIRTGIEEVIGAVSETLSGAHAGAYPGGIDHTETNAELLGRFFEPQVAAQRRASR
jgi:hypothetical protein